MAKNKIIAPKITVQKGVALKKQEIRDTVLIRKANELVEAKYRFNNAGKTLFNFGQYRQPVAVFMWKCKLNIALWRPFGR